MIFSITELETLPFPIASIINLYEAKMNPRLKFDHLFDFFEALTEFISFVEKNCKKEGILFRGQQRNWSLLPKIARLELKQRLRPTENDMIRDLQRTGHPYVGHFQFYNKKEGICIDPLAFAQHNGMATRLLDWTLNPLAALWFAVRKAPAKDNEDKLLDGVVWIFCPDNECNSIVSRGSAFPKNGVYIHKSILLLLEI